jgi:formylglycine-generating enzyme required for sulfatase activity
MKIIPQGLVISILLLSEILITEARAQDVCTDPVKALSQAKPEQEKAIEQLGKCGKPAIPKVLDLLKTSQDTGLQLAASEVLGKMGTDAIAPLTLLLKDPQAADSSRKLAIDSLSDIAKSEKKARNSILETLKERQEDPQEDQIIRLEAKEALEEIPLVIPFPERVEKMVTTYPQIATGAGIFILLSLAYSGVLRMKPRWLLNLPAKLTIPNVKVELPVGLLLWLKYRPQVLDAWVADHLQEVGEKFLNNKTVDERLIYIPIDVKHGKKRELTIYDLREMFKRSPTCLLIVGEGGAGKTSLACQIARWGLEGEIAHPMIPVLIEDELQDTPLLTQIRDHLPRQDGNFISDELLEVLLKQGRVLVILDHVSEMSDATYNKMRDALKEKPINALIITSRLDEKGKGLCSNPTLLKPQKIEGARLSEFIRPYLERKNIPADDHELYSICLRLSGLMAAILQDATALLVTMYVDQVIDEGELKRSQLPDNIPDLILEYLCRLNRSVDRQVRLDDVEVQEDGKLIAWECLKETYLPSNARYQDVLGELTKTKEDGKKRLDYLIDRLLLVQRLKGNKIRIALDPVAEYLAALALVDRCQDQEIWAEFLQEVDKKPDLSQIRGFLLAVRNCCEQKAKSLPNGVLEELNKRADLDPEALEQARRRQRINGFIDNLDDIDPHYQAQAIQNLQNQGKYAYRAIPELQKMTTNQTIEPILRVQALNSLMQIQTDIGERKLFYKGILGDRSQHESVRGAAIKNLLEFAERQELIALLRVYLEDESESGVVRVQAGEGLRKLQALDCLLLVNLSEDGTPTIQKSPLVETQIINLPNDVSLVMVSIQGGKFLMGSPEGEGYSDEKPQHEVTIPDFWIGQYPITQEQYQAVMGTNPSTFQDTEGKKKNYPVERVTWNDAVEFCQRLSELTNQEFRLPSEAEWEYSCRARTTTPFYFGATITTDYANYRGTDGTTGGNTYLGNYGLGPKGIFREETTEVGSFPANAFGLYDMHGNVWEWCADDWHENYKGAPEDGTAWLNNNSQQGNYKCLRGGSWLYNPVDCRSACRNLYDGRDLRSYNFGFRVLCVVGRTR